MGKNVIEIAKRPEVIQAGVDAKRAAEDQAHLEGKSDEEVEVAGKNASLEARKAMIAKLQQSG